MKDLSNTQFFSGRKRSADSGKRYSGDRVQGSE